MKPGVRTTEFWVSTVLALVGPLVTVFVGAGVFDAADAPAVTETITGGMNGLVGAVTVIVANVTSLLAVKQYVRSRTEIKVSTTTSPTIVVKNAAS